jgi:glyoxylase-like metal-dependent hydrolase (beta-lactamase superfamily II)
MVQEILKGIYRLEIPMPGNPLKALNSYLIKGEKKHLLIDTGFNWSECREAQLNGMASLGIEWRDC